MLEQLTQSFPFLSRQLLAQQRHRFLQQKFVTLLSLLLVAFNTATLGYLVYQNWGLLITYHWAIDWYAFCMTFFAYSINQLVILFGWYQLTLHFNIPGTFFEHIKIFVYSEISKRVPGKFWYIAGRVILYQQQGAAKTEVVVASGVETVLILNGSLLGYLLSYAWIVTAGTPSTPAIGIRLLVVAALNLILLHPQVLNWMLRRMKQRQVMGHVAYQKLLLWLFIYTVGRFCTGLMIFWWLRTFEFVPLYQLPGVVATMSITGIMTNLLWFLPFTLGMYELALTFLLKSFVSIPTALIVAVLLRVLLWGYQLLYFAIVNFLDSKFNPKLQPVEKTTPN